MEQLCETPNSLNNYNQITISRLMYYCMHIFNGINYYRQYLKLMA